MTFYPIFERSHVRKSARTAARVFVRTKNSSLDRVLTAAEKLQMFEESETLTAAIRDAGRYNQPASLTRHEGTPVLKEIESKN